MSTPEAGTEGMVAEAGRALTRAGAVRLAQSYVAAYNDRDLDAMLALQDEHIVSYPVRMFGHRSLTGHAGVRAWWESMEASGRWYEVVVGEIRQLLPDRVAILGEIRDQGELVSPWGVVVRIRNGLIIESRSYLSDKEVLDELGLLENPRRG
jgi:ketosteroid isomerase-like protein